MDYSFAYQLAQAPGGRNDGSGCCSHQIMAMYREQGSTDPWSVVPARHKTFELPAADLKVVMDMPHSSGPEKQAKNAAYKQLIAANLNTAALPITGWTTALLEQCMDNNDAAALEAGRANEYITVTLGLTYPVQFQY